MFKGLDIFSYIKQRVFFSGYIISARPKEDTYGI